VPEEWVGDSRTDFIRPLEGPGWRAAGPTAGQCALAEDLGVPGLVHHLAGEEVLHLVVVGPGFCKIHRRREVAGHELDLSEERGELAGGQLQFLGKPAPTRPTGCPSFEFHCRAFASSYRVTTLSPTVHIVQQRVFLDDRHPVS